jgi:acyl carrier protein
VGGSDSDPALGCPIFTPPGPGPTAAELRTYLSERLPPHLRPDAYGTLAALPLTRNGKVDRGRLTATAVETPPAAAAPEARAVTRTPEASGTGAEGEIGAVWAKVLRLDAVDPEASFYDLGGDSLGAARILTEVRKRFGVTIPLDQLYEVRTVRRMAARVAGGAP